MGNTTTKTPWHPIADYATSPAKLQNPELTTLAKVWQQQRDTLEQNNEVIAFQKKLCHEWAIETGLIENLYTLDRGITQMLIERGIDASLIPHGSGPRDTTPVAEMIKDHLNVVEGLFSYVKSERSLSTSYIKEMHAQLTRHQETTTAINGLGRLVEVALIHGDYKNRPNNPTRPDGIVHEYCPPEHVQSEMETLLQLHHTHTEVAPEVEAAWLHHRFTQIHPFQDGNGRVARCLATIIFLKAGQFPLVIRNRQRGIYIDALESADQGDLAPLVHFFATAQKDALIKALSVASEVHEEKHVETAISGLLQHLTEKTPSASKEWDKAKVIANDMNNTTYARFNKIAEQLKQKTHQVHPRPEFNTQSASNNDPNSHHFHRQIGETAKQMDYHANTREFRAWTRLTMHLHEQTNILVSFHGIGHEYRGVLVASACFFTRSPSGLKTEEQETSTSTPLSDEVFQINYLESSAEAQKRFTPWLDNILTKGLQTWRNGL